MLYQGMELHGVSELLAGSGLEVLPPPAQEWARQNGGLAGWEAQQAGPLWITRVPDPLRRSLNPLAQINALQATGAEARFNLRGERVRLVLQCMAPAVAEVHYGGFFAGWHVIGTQPTELELTRPANADVLERLAREKGMGFDPRLMRVLLPWRPALRLVEVEGDCEPPQPGQTPARRYLAYGSSITHGNAAVRPSAMYAHRVAQLLGADFLNLGFGGGAHQERGLADAIATRTDWDFATLEMGINLLGIAPDDFAARVEYFVNRIARAHPDRWVYCLDVFLCHDDLTGGGRARRFREIVRETVRRAGLPKLVHVAGDALLTSLHGLTADLVHPSPFGMEEIARNLAAVMAPGAGQS
jgi:lysophospholipase L1-like esterase